MFIKNKRNKGITLIALVVTIIVLLILAGISISMLAGEGGILTNAKEARDKTGEAQAKEELDMYLMEYSGNKNLGDTTDLKTFLKSKGYTVKDTGDGKLQVEKDGYIFIVDPDTLSTTLKEKGLPEMNIQVEGPDEDKKVSITVTVTNVDEFESIEDITLTSPDGTKVRGTVNKEAGTATFKVEKNGIYTVDVKATADGKEKSEKQTVKVNQIPAEIGKIGFGTIDVIWVDKDNNIQSNPESPEKYLSGMTKVAWTWDEGTKTWTEKKEAPSTNEEWYSYRALEEGSKNDNKGENGSHWANAKNPNDGSYFVWIPRYAYRITYYTDEQTYRNGEEPLAYFDGNGLTDKDGAKVVKVNGGTIEIKMGEKVQTVIKDEKSYIVHPAFYGPGSEALGGGFGTDKGIVGIWVAKYEMSEDSKTNNPVSKPGVSPYWQFESIGQYYTRALNYDEGKVSHLMKCSEWGAVAYLAHSQYGRNGHEITINNNSNHYTGMAGDSVSAEVSSTTNSYDTEAGGLASTTGNVYGIYDMSGGTLESMACYDSSAGDALRWGNSFAYKDGQSTKFANTRLDVLDGVGFAQMEIKGEWFGDYRFAASNGGPFEAWGGNCSEAERAGLFASRKDTGSIINGEHMDKTFRVVLVGGSD